MCGIAGFWTSGSPRYLSELAGRMVDRLSHRGPDDRGVWEDAGAGFAMGHRRLSIIDLSAAGHQPMISPCGRFTLTYNGEIYNHGELRSDLELEYAQPAWRGDSDTETLLAALRHWGVEGALQRLNGMFAFALWDRSERKLHLARDRMGEKPLYYGRCGTTLLFGSELKALAAHPDWRGEVDRNALTMYLRHNYVPAPWSIYQGVRKLPPAHYLTIAERNNVLPEPLCYWNLGRIAEAGVAKASGDAESLVDDLDALLRDAVGRRMAADVPLGAFLSGGYDSTMVVAQMQAQSRRPIKTFSIGFHEEAHNEARHAKAVAAHLGTDHTELYVTPEDAMATIPELPRIWDEPFSDSSQIPTYLVSQLARQQVIVCLSGDGGDELFCGYGRYALACRIWGKLGWMPRPSRTLLAALLRRFPARSLNAVVARVPGAKRYQTYGDRLLKLAEILAMRDGEAFYRSLVSHWKVPEEVVRGGVEPDTLLSNSAQWPALPGLRERMMYFDALTYLPDDILTKVDRASMAVGLEARVPLLDHRVVEFAWRVPTEFKYRNGEAKWLLRQVLYRYVPRSLMDRPKMGFGVPIEHWLRGPLRDWGENLLDERRLSEDDYFAPEPIRMMWREHLSGQRRWHYYLWDVLMFQSWLDHRADASMPCEREVGAPRN